VGVAPAARISFGGDQHVLAERGQMTAADWTAIGRRLAAARTSRRPPRRGRKSGHGAIVPLAAIAVGVGVAAALAKSELKRRRHKQEPSSKLKRQTLEQIDLAIALLEGRREVPPERTIHETRKALKRARALVRLQQSALGAKRFARNNAVLREAGRRLATARDAEVVIDALDGLIERHPKRLAHSQGAARLRTQLIAERERSQAHTRHGAQVRVVVLGELRAARAEVERWEPARGDGKTARVGLEAIYRAGRKRARRARKVKSSAALHDWRKRAKDLRYVAEALELRGVAKRAERLGETIGEEHDLWLLARCLRRQRKCFRGEEAARKELQRHIARRRRRLRKRAFRLGAELYHEPPKRFVRRCLAH
jgi:CHAD domain-containing protein